MKRAPFVIAATAAGLAAVLSFHTPSVPQTLRSLSGSGSSKSKTGSSVATGSPPNTSGGSTSSTTTTAPGSSTTTTTNPRASAKRSATGPTVNYSYGTLAVEVTVSGSHISNVGIASLNDGGNFRSQSIDEQSIPVLESQAIAAQGANIQGVSGATYTSGGFAQSLQGALKKLGL